MFNVRPFESRTINWWYDERDNIDFNPSYQRKGGLWSSDNKAYLIDSILNKFDIPKIYLADFTYKDTDLNENQKAFAIIDGKQRFEAIFDFYDGKLSLANDFELLENPKLKLGGLSYKDLKSNYPKISRDFDNFNLSVMSVITDQEDQINELFIRLNTNRPLTGAEIRSAMAGQVPNLIKGISSNRFFKKNIRFSIKRKQDENIAAKLLLIEFRGKFVDTKKVHLDRFVEEGIKSEVGNFENAYNRVNSVLSNMSKAFNISDPLLRSSGSIPVYYWLFKKHNKHLSKLREYIVDFEKIRTKIKQIDNITEDIPIEQIQAFITYNSAIRSPNDGSAMHLCYSIIQKGFENFINNING